MERWVYFADCSLKELRNKRNFIEKGVAQSAGAVEYTDCTSAEG